MTLLAFGQMRSKICMPASSSHLPSTCAVVAVIKLSLPAGKANPAPPVGPALGSKGVNIMSFCKQYNEATSSQAGRIIPAEITVYQASGGREWGG